MGPQLLQVGPYEELLNVSTKWVLEKERFLGGSMGEAASWLFDVFLMYFVVFEC